MSILTALETAAAVGNLPKLKHMLEGRSANLDEVMALLRLSASKCRYATVEWLLTGPGAGVNITELETSGGESSLWRILCGAFYRINIRVQANVAELTSLFKVLTLLGDAPTRAIGYLIPEHKALVEVGRRLRARLPAYLDQRHTFLLAHCPLPSVLQSLVAAYAEPTREDIWSSRLV
jgi:hypothetical protein